ncbi:LA_2478/LA_2722/LA_4182 family protein [Leptospira meyeri]|uniref:LA_2478/LA_2722/LA_4182 family protein n=1 Tax=Leptospira meyeri TaxID=29508 RepID=UPI001A9C9561|nr:hypothetical protein [Leptospira meyeri]
MKLLNILFPKLGGGAKRNVNNMRNWGNKRYTVSTNNYWRNIRNAYITIQVLIEDMENTIKSFINAAANIRTTHKSRVTTDDIRTTINGQTYNSHLKLNKKNGILIFVSILVLETTVSCKKDKGIVNLEWQNESLSLTSEICAKYRECADKEWKSIPENLKKFTEGRLDEAQCQKRFRESNAYKLIGADPFEIQTVYKECHKQILLFSCKDLQEGKIETVPTCVAFQKIQNGN